MKSIKIEKLRIKKKKFKKNKFILLKLIENSTNIICNIKNVNIFKNLSLYKNILRNRVIKNLNNIELYKGNEIFAICLSQRLNNLKTTISCKRNLNTYSIGTILKYFKIGHGKYIRRNIRGVKILLNFLKNIFKKKYQKNFLKKKGEIRKVILLNIIGLDYNLINLKKSIKNIFEKNYFFLKSNVDIYYLINLKISFTKVKSKKVKAIKKRLKKKILLSFLKNNKN